MDPPEAGERRTNPWQPVPGRAPAPDPAPSETDPEWPHNLPFRENPYRLYGVVLLVDVARRLLGGESGLEACGLPQALLADSALGAVLVSGILIPQTAAFLRALLALGLSVGLGWFQRDAAHALGALHAAILLILMIGRPGPRRIRVAGALFAFWAPAAVVALVGSLLRT